LEIESGMNDPMAVYLTLAMIAWVKASLGGEDLGLTGLLALMVQQFGWGAVVGLGGGFALSWLLPRLAARTELRAGPLALL
ncbi:K+/H+ antiporter, partial [Escherichia coli]|nr:K+/H+ antiporter [Escherichia coli]